MVDNDDDPEDYAVDAAASAGAERDPSPSSQEGSAGRSHPSTSRAGGPSQRQRGLYAPLSYQPTIYLSIYLSTNSCVQDKFAFLLCMS